VGVESTIPLTISSPCSSGEEDAEDDPGHRREKTSLTHLKCLWMIYITARLCGWQSTETSCVSSATVEEAKLEPREPVPTVEAVALGFSFDKSVLVWCSRCRALAVTAAVRAS